MRDDEHAAIEQLEARLKKPARQRTRRKATR